MTHPISPSQTIGPFSHEAWRWACSATDAVAAGPNSLSITGILRDGNGEPIDDAMIEAWSPASVEAEAGIALPGFRRTPSDMQGGFHFTLPLPAVSGAGEPVMFVTVFARGLLMHQFSAVFLEDDGGLARSEILQQVPEQRRATLIARKNGPASYAWDINMQGENETVFFDYA
jgi:protocatechuate 3,4-dioxygenase alpha subunit